MESKFTYEAPQLIELGTVAEHTLASSRLCKGLGNGDEFSDQLKTFPGECP
jgi:hypothetical protein